MSVRPPLAAAKQRHPDVTVHYYIHYSGCWQGFPGEGVHCAVRELLPVLLLALMVPCAHAQVPSPAESGHQVRYNFALRHYTVADGLPTRRVSSLAQDDQGFIWMASPMGLVRYDGYRFINHNSNDGLSDDAVNSVLRDADGMLWIQYEDGAVDIMDPMRCRAMPFAKYFAKGPADMLRAPIQGMAASAAGTIVFGQAGALVRYRGAALGFERKAVPCNGPLRPTVVEENDDVWCECAAGFVHTSTEELLFLASDAWAVDGPQPTRWEGVAMAPAKGLDRSDMRPPVAPGAYITLLRSGLAMSGWVQPDGTRIVHDGSSNFPQTHLRYNYRMPLSADMWLVDDKVRRMRAGDVPYDAPVLFDLAAVDVDMEKEISSVLRDRAGNIWIANDHGLFKLTLEEDHFRRYLYQPQLHGSTGIRIRGMAEVAGRLHVNTDVNGYYVLDARSGEVLHWDSRTPFRVGMASDGRGGLWRAESSNLVHEGRNGNSDGRVHSREGTSPIWSVLELHQGAVMMGTESGLRMAYLPDSARAVVHPDHPELDLAMVWHLGRDREGSILACTNKGLYRLDEQGMVLQRWWSGGDRAKDSLQYLPVSDIRHFQEGPAGVFWLSTGTSGVLQWNREMGSVRTFGHRQGFPAASIHAVYPDDSGILWMPSDNGLVRFDPVTEQVKVFTTLDGIAHNEFNRVAHCRSADGHFYFGGLNGITVFHPEKVGASSGSQQAPLVLLAVHIQHADSTQPSDRSLEVMYGKPMVMQHTDRFFTVDMALLSYGDPGEIRYAWLIDGIDRAWNFQPEPHLRFTTLPYGEHVLRIKALDRNGQWSANELSIPITMLRPIYLRWWFLLAGVVAFAAAGYGLVQYRIRQLRKVIRVRDRIALDLHDEVGSNLSSIVLFSTAVGTNAGALPPKAASMLERITENSTRAMESMNDIVWSVNSSNDHIEDLVDRMRAYAEPLCEAAEVQLDFTIGKGLLARRLGMEERKSLYLIFKEALNNAVKHAACTDIDVALTMADGRFNLVVADNGKGITANHMSKGNLGGNGLGNMRRRAVEVGGTLEIGQAKQSGTQILFSVPSRVV